MREVGDASFDREVLQAPRPVVVDFWAPWCRPCRAVTRILEELAAEHGERVDFVAVNVDESPRAAAQAGVLSLPTAMLFETGEARSEVIGARDRRHYERAWSRWLG